jgi:Putative beta barrel porin-7 (BBP7)
MLDCESGLPMQRHSLPIVLPLTAMLIAIAAATGSAVPAAAAELALPTKAPLPPAAASPFWVDLEYLEWSVSGDKLPPLVTTGTAPQATAGVLGAPGTAILFGNSSVNNDWRPGGQITAGYWLDPGHSRGVELNFFGLADTTTNFAASSSGTPILARPFTDASTGLPSSSLIAFPGAVAGAVNVSDRSRLLGAGAFYRQDIGTWSGQEISALIGYRFLYESDRLGISSTVTATGAGAGVLVGTVLATSDSFSATNTFHGLDLGLLGKSQHGPWSLDWQAGIALGASLNEAQISGSTAATFGGVTATLPGGLLALSSNSGDFTQARFAAVPNLSLKGGYEFAPSWHLVADYDLLYWTGVQRAGNLIDTTINSNLLPNGPGGGPQRPQFQFDTTSLLAQGFSAGIRHEF